MKIHIRRIQSQGLELEETYPSEWVGLTRKEGIEFVEPITLKVKLTRADEELIADINAKSRYESFCYRCLKDMAEDWTADFKVVVDLEKEMEFVEIDEDIRQELILNLPTRILCKEDCKGLCIDCGIDLNKEVCKHVSGGKLAAGIQNKLKSVK